MIMKGMVVCLICWVCGLLQSYNIINYDLIIVRSLNIRDY